MRGELSQIDVTVIGGGLAGMAASFHLAKAGMKVVCIDPDTETSKAVGESLDWSAPDLLSALGFPMQRLIGEGIGTYKRHVTLRLGNGCDRHYVPSEWLGRPPFNVELRTLHVDRLRLNRELLISALSHGVELIRDKVVEVEKKEQTVTAVITSEGRSISSSWFIDASGAAASLFPRAFQLPMYAYGPKKVAVWTYFDVPEMVEGTTLYAHGTMPSYMEWIWEIPIRPGAISVGYVATGEAIKLKRKQGLSIEEIFREQLGHFPRFERLLQTAKADAPWVTSYLCCGYRKVAGPNWFVAGEAASMVDPMTANGVTAALRHAEEATDLILRNRRQGRLPRRCTSMYSRRVSDLGRFFNSGIERVVYDWPIRKRIGVLNAGDLYTVPAWTLNNIYSRLRPKGVASTLLFGSLLNVIRISAELYHSLCRRLESSRNVTG